MFGLAHLVVSAERVLQDNTLYARDEQRSELRVWLWRHKVLLLAATGVLVLLIIGGNGI